jgi:hypothetical protein
MAKAGNPGATCTCTYAACRSVEWIIDDGNRASEVIRRVRTLAKKTSLEKVPLDVNDVVRDHPIGAGQSLIRATCCPM